MTATATPAPQSLIQRLTEIVSEAFEAEGLDPALGRVQISDRPDLAQFQCNGALPAAKAKKTNPRQLGEAVAARLRAREIFDKVEVAGPGFVNLTLTDAALSSHADAVAADARQGVPVRPAEKVVLDFGGPNVAKPMHVGHLRSSIIGDALQRLFRFAGDETVSDVHMGDWGLQMGMLISELEIRHPELPYFQPGAEGPFPEESPVTLEDLERLYPRANTACKTDERRMSAAQAATARLQEGHPGYRALWRHFMDVSVKAMKREFSSLGVEFDLWKGEASVDPLIPDLVRDFKERGIARESEGAWVVPVAREDDKKEMPPLILTKRDGSVLYATTDLATILERTKEIEPDLVLYVVDQRQHLHFEQVFRAAREAGIDGGARLEHIGFGTMNDPEGKPFKTRAGGVMKLYDLLEMATDKARERLDEAGLLSDAGTEERGRIARQVGIAAVKFADLQNYRLSDYVFDLDRFMRFEGKTGPYLQYAAVRIKSLFAKAEAQGLAPGGAIRVESAVERDLVLALAQFPEAVRAAYDRRAPNVICDHVYGIAQAFSRFYTEHHILSEPDEDLRASRLTLSAAALRQLELCLDLLGIEIPDRM